MEAELVVFMIQNQIFDCIFEAIKSLRPFKKKVR